MDDNIFAHITGHMDRGMSSDIAAAIASSRAIKLVASSGTSRKVPADGGGVCNIYIFIRINCSFKNKKFNKKTKEKETPTCQRTQRVNVYTIACLIFFLQGIRYLLPVL